MGEQTGPNITEYFRVLKDPRVERTRRHCLNDILVIAICAVVGGADSWVAVEQFGNAKIAWFRSFLDLPNGVPSHDTFGRVFATLDPDQFSKCFANWLSSVAQTLTGQIVAIDGKTLRKSFDTAASKGSIHMVSAWTARAPSNWPKPSAVTGESRTNCIGSSTLRFERMTAGCESATPHRTSPSCDTSPSTSSSGRRARRSASRRRD